MADLASYTRRHPHFPTALPPLLERVARPGIVADLGCGDGAVLEALAAAGRLGETTYAVDLSPERVARATERVPSAIGVAADAAATGLPAASVDGVVCSQVIEHVLDPSALVEEIARILCPGGWWYVGSVLRGRRAFWVYRAEGAWRLDPTHVREYGSAEAFRRSIAHPALRVEAVLVSPFRFPLSHLLARALRLDRPLPLGDGLALGPPGYRRVEAAGERAIASA